MARLRPIAIWILFLIASRGFAAAAPGVTVFDADPQNLWNRLYANLLIRTGPTGAVYGTEGIDPLIWPNTRFLLTEPARGEALTLLREFADHTGSAPFKDPVRRLVFQRDLWAVFDWAAGQVATGLAAGEPARDFLRPLAMAIRRLALTTDEIASLADNYRTAVESGEFPGAFSPQFPDRAYLPPKLFDPAGPWVCLQSQRLLTGEFPKSVRDSAKWTENVAPVHLRDFGGRSAFLIFLCLPGGRAATLGYLARLNAFQGPAASPDTPQFPAGTQVALVRQMLALDAEGQLRPTGVTEDVQIRICTGVDPKGYGDEQQQFYEFDLSRSRYFSAKAGGLRAVGRDETGFPRFRTVPGDPFDSPAWRKKPHAFPILNCADCHAEVGIHSIASRSQLFTSVTAKPPALTPCTPDQARASAIEWKQGLVSWGLLQGLGVN